MNTNTSAQTVRFDLVPVHNYGGWNLRHIATGRIVKDSCGSNRYFATNAQALTALDEANNR